MAEILSPGVFIQEVPSSVQVIQSVSTSNLGIVGYTLQGPTDKATLVTSYPQYEQIFGGLTRNSYTSYEMAAFFANGGTRAYVVRVVPSDATNASCQIRSQTYDQAIETGDGVTAAFTKTATTSLLKDNTGASPLIAGSFSIKWRGGGTPVTGQALKKRDGTTALLGDGASTKYEFRVDPAAIPAPESGLYCVVPIVGGVVLKWASGGAKTITIAQPPLGSTIGTGTSGDGTAIFDYATGFGSVTTTVAATIFAFTLDYTPANATKTVVDDGAGALTAGANLTGPGTITYATGAYSFTTNATTFVPHLRCPILANYKIAAWSLVPVAKGAWGNNLRVLVQGAQDAFVAASSSYTKYNFKIQLKDSFGSYNTVEAYEDLVMSPATDPSYFAENINQLSDYLTITEPAGNEAPGELNAVLRTRVLGGGDESAAGRAFSVTLLYPTVAKRTVSITYTSGVDSLVKTITDDGSTGTLTGSVDATVANTVNYTTGVLAFSTADVVKVGTLVTVTYYTSAAESIHTETFGDTTKSYTVGSDGTFTSNTYGRTQLTSSASLSATYKGLFALDKVDEMMNVIVPDYAGDTTVSGDLLDYAATRAAQPSGGDRFIILTVPKGSQPTDASDWVQFKLARFSDYAAVYWPWVQISDPLALNRPYVIPPLGHIAGVYARTDSNKNVGKSPGGTVDGALNYLIALERTSTQAERDAIYPKRVNPLISTPQTGTAVWGVRTISASTDWKYVSARRLFMFVEKSVYNSTQWIVFENNGPALWARIKAQLNGFLTNLFQQGYFAGTSPSEAFFVICDGSNNTSDSVNLGQVNITVGIAPNKPAEFVVFKFTTKQQ
jgi:phage tail sheath protein FI